MHQLINRPIYKLYPLEIRANENTEKNEIIADQTIVDSDITCSYELKQRLSRRHKYINSKTFWAGVNSLTYSCAYRPTLLFVSKDQKKRGVC